MRRLQQWVAKEIINMFPWLSSDDVRSAPAGVPGADVQLSQEAQKYFPYQAECKAREDTIGLYKMYDQAYNHGDLEPLVFVRKNRRETLVIMNAEHFFSLYKRIK